MKNSGICICSVLGGIIAGSIVTMLVTPKNGREMRESIRDFVNGELNRIKCRCKDAANEIESMTKHYRTRVWETIAIFSCRWLQWRRSR